MTIRGDIASQLNLAPLGAGDLIDRAIRYYRKNIVTFVMTAAPPILAGAVISVAWTLLARSIFAPSQYAGSDDIAFYRVFSGIGGVVIWIGEFVAALVVMGGASRNFVRHLLFGESITFAETYRNVWHRLGSLVAASASIGFALAIFAIFIFYFTLVIAFICVALVAAVLGIVPYVAVIVGIAVFLAGGYGGLWIFFAVASRVAFVPQIMLVEGMGVGKAISRNISLATGSVHRLMALFLFTLAASIAALAILYVPFMWFAWANGVDITFTAEDAAPAWVEIGYALISQLSLIMLMPVWTIGMCILYVDERVRAEGYDIELMAARRLGDIPSVPVSYENPLQPAISATSAGSVNVSPAVRETAGTILGLDND